jgi:hypothetical protein
MNKLVDLFNNLQITDDNSDIEALIDNIQILTIDDKPIKKENRDKEIDDLINNMNDLKINDGKIIIESTKGTKLIINFADCGIAYRRVNPFPIPRYIDSF